MAEKAVNPWELDWSAAKQSSEVPPWELDWSAANKTAIDIGLPDIKVINPTEYEDPIILDVPKPGADLAAKGIDVTSGAPTGRFTASFAKDINYAASYMKKALSEYYDADIQVRIGPDSGRLEFLRPEENRWALADEARTAIADFQDFGGALPAIAAFSGMLLGASVGGGSVLSATGGASASAGSVAGAGFGEYIRLKIGEALGANDGISGLEVGSEVVSEMLWEAAFVYGSQGIVGTRRWWKNLKSPQAMPPEDAIIALGKMNQNRQLASDIDALSPGNFRPTTGQMAEDEYLLGIQQGYTGDSLKASAEMSELLKSNETALEGALDAITPQTGNVYQAGKITTEASGRGIAETEEALATSLALKQDIAAHQLARVPNMSEQEAGRGMRQAFANARLAAKTAETEAYTAYKAAYGFNPETASSTVRIPISQDFARYMRGIEASRANAIFGGQQTGKGQLLSERLGGEGVVDIDLHQLDEGLRYLRRAIRKSPNAPAPDAPVSDMIKMKSELQLLRDNHLGATNPALLDLALAAEQSASYRASTFDTGVLGTIIKRDGSEYMLNDTRVFAYVIKSNDAEAAEHFSRVVGEDPGAMVAAKEGLWSFYRREVAPNGYVDPKLHRKFMSDRSNVINAMFSPAEVNRMNALGDMGRVVERTAKQYENLVSELSKTFSGRISSTEPEHIVTAVFSTGFSERHTRQLMTMLDSYGTGQTYREAVGTYVRNKVFLNGKINANNLDKLLQKESGKLTHIFGGEYVQNLGKIRDGIHMVRQNAKGLVPRKTNAFTDLMRFAFAPPLTARGRGQTLLVNLRSDSAKRALGEAIRDPNALEAIIQLSSVDLRSKRAARVLSSIGAPFIPGPTD